MMEYNIYDIAEKPAWLQALLTEKFFVACASHETARKNEKNIFCLDCIESICPHCLTFHRSHRLLQIRRYVYHDVVRLDDMEKLVDCSYVQAYTTNSAKVVFLNQRPQTRPFKGTGNICCTCDRSLQESFYFCSVCCKIDYLVRRGKNLSKYLYDCEYLSIQDLIFTPSEGLNLKEIAEGHTSPNSTLDNSLTLHTVSISSGDNVGVGCTDAVVSSYSRRKGIPQRAPLY